MTLDYLAGTALLISLILLLLAGAGAVKLPDLYTRMAAISKAATLSLVLACLAAGLLSNRSTQLQLVLTVLFFFISSPMAAHLIGKMGYRSGAQLCDQTQVDDWERYQ